MKAKFFKFLLPAFAILMAVGLAFATENERVAQEAYYFLPGVGWQTVMVEENCSDEGTVPCVQKTGIVYHLRRVKVSHPRRTKVSIVGRMNVSH